MIPEDAIWILELIRNRDARTEAEKDAVNAAIEALKAQLSQQGTTSDLISRTETVEHLRRVLGATVPITDYDDGFVDGVEFGVSTVSTMPTIQPQSTTGQLNDGAQSTAQSTDLIDRQDAIDALDKRFDNIPMEQTAEILMLRKDLRELPTIQPEVLACGNGELVATPEPHWIPVSERLPETGVEVLTYYGAFDYIEIQTLEDGRWENQRGDWQNLDDITAWMPLPTPYRKGAAT